MAKVSVKVGHGGVARGAAPPAAFMDFPQLPNASSPIRQPEIAGPQLRQSQTSGTRVKIAVEVGGVLRLF